MSVHLLRNISDVNRDYLCIAQYNLTYESDRSLMKKYSFVEYLGKSSLDEYLMNMKRSKYCLSPHGMWPDCYRHWEAMYMGCIPITLKHEKLEKFYDMPILFLDSWEELTEEMLIDKYEEISGRSRHKLELEYWIQLAKNIKGV